MIKPKYLLIALALFCACASKREPFFADVYLNGTIRQTIKVYKDTLTFYDSSRNREIPTAIYQRKDTTIKRLAIINPGYGGTKDDYAFIASKLAKKGYLVVTIQHDLPGDAPMPNTGDLYKLRKPVWDRGVKSIFFVTEQLKRRYAEVDFDDILLIGHSNGGDMAMLIANEYPLFARRIISLDNRRMPFPRARRPTIFSLRSSDQPADQGVLPSAEEQKKYGIKIVKVTARHNDMGGSGTEGEKKEIVNYILNFLGED
ncbi:MAG TPA: hypothetical protein VIM55_17430 [Mucilaginibacter sp.]